MSQEKIGLLKLQMRNNLISVAKTWLNTPYQHQAMVKGVGTDCVGLVVGAGIEAGVLNLTPMQIKTYSGYGRLPHPHKMKDALKKHFTSCIETDIQIGDIAWIQWRQNLPMHLAILSEHNGVKTLLHSISDIGKVVEHTLTKQWDERIVSFWRYPGLN